MMTSKSLTRTRQSFEDDYGLGVIAKHNAETNGGFPSYHGDSADLENVITVGRPQRPHGTTDSHPITPARSDQANNGVRTRSGRTILPTDSPLSIGNSGPSKSPAPKPKRDRRSKLDKSKTPKLTAPLSELTKDMTVPVRDIEAWVNRSATERRKEVEKRNGYITRPMNSFMLYRSAYAERTKQWCLQNNHQVVSSVSGESWPMEPDEVRNRFDKWARTERANHQAAHPGYKFSPSKAATNKRRKADFSEEEEPSDLDDDPDGEFYNGRNVRQKIQVSSEPEYLSDNHNLDSHPYYSHQVNGYDQPQYQLFNTGWQVSSNIAYDQYGLPYDTLNNTYLPLAMNRYSPFLFVPDPQESNDLRSGSLGATQSLGGYGLPGGHVSMNDIISESRTSTPMQRYGQFGQQSFPQDQIQYQQYHPVQPAAVHGLGIQEYEHQQYLQLATRPRAAIDPSLDPAKEALSAGTGQGHRHSVNHFEEALGDMTSADLAGYRDYYDQSTARAGVNATLAPAWLPHDMH